MARPEPSDRKPVCLARSGDRRAFDAIVLRYQDMVYAPAVHGTASHDHDGTVRAFDRQTKTRWWTGDAAQEPGMFHQLAPADGAVGQTPAGGESGQA